MRNKLEQITSQSNALFLVDENTFQCFQKLGLNEEQVLVVPAGEESKSLDISKVVWDKLVQLNLKRNDTLVCVGGGVITDLGAFCASTFKRGMRLIHVPTSLLAMVDAAIGGKTGINFRDLKNFIGTFSEPDSIFVCQKFLATLPEREIRSGYAEIIKHALIADRDFWNEIKVTSSLTVAPNIETIQTAARIKENIVSEDFTENSTRKLLNFGHTVGHALESYSFAKGNAIPHGDAVAAGMIIEAFISSKVSGLNDQGLKEISEFIKAHYEPVHWFDGDEQKVIALAYHDKKTMVSGINCTLLREIGSAQIDQNVSAEDLLGGLKYYQTQYSN